MKEYIKIWLKENIVKIIIAVIFVAINMYVLTYPPKIIGKIIDLLCDIEKNKTELFKMILFLIISAIAFMATRVPWKNLITNVVLNFEKGLKDNLFNHFMKLEMNNIQNIKNGEIMTLVTKDVGEQRRLLFGILSFGTRVIFTSIIATYTMINGVNLKLTLITLSPVVITTILIIIVKIYVERTSKIAREKFSNLSEFVQESTDGIRTIKAYSGEENQINEFKLKNKELTNAEIKVSFFKSLLSTIINIGFGICTGIAILYGSKLVINNEITIGDLIAFIGYISLFIDPIYFVPMIITRYKVAKISYEKLDKILKLNEEDLKIYENEKGTISGDIIIKNLTYNYPANIEVALKNINLNIKEGQTLGIIGTIGSGKTTLMNLLLRLYKVPNGVISIGGKDINDIELNDLRNSICYITQEHFLFSTSLKENISLFRDHSDDAIIESTKSAMIYDDIERMDEGINTIVGERGIDLSGGQKQRVVISRAFLQKSNIVIFDDTFSALDNKTESSLLKNIKTLTYGKTCIIISNRVSDIKDSDNIIVLDDGEIIEQGTHDTLLNNNGLYKKFYNQQSSKIDMEVGDLIG